MPRHAVVIGGGFAGLRAAVALADAGLRVSLLEGRVGLGGRARSFADPASGETVDNGQHLFLSGYLRTLAFLDRLGTRDRIYFQDRLQVAFVEPGGKLSALDCPAASPPWHFLLGVVRSSRLGLTDKLGLWNIWRDLRPVPGTGSVPGTGLDDRETVEQWLVRLGQGRRAREGFWHPLTIAALNEDPRKVSAVGLKTVLRALLNGPPSEARLGLPLVGLTELYAFPAQKLIQEKGGEIFLNRPAAGLQIQEGRVNAVLLADGSKLSADAVICALPPRPLCRLLPQSLREGEHLAASLSRFGNSPIVSVNLWLDRPLPGFLFMALIRTRFQWVFNKPAILRAAGKSPTYVSLILSAAHEFIHHSNEELSRIAWEDLRACFPSLRDAKLLRSQVVREREATVSLRVGAEAVRPGPKTSVPNLFLAGDWIATGLPATIESAVISGESAARALLQ